VDKVSVVITVVDVEVKVLPRALASVRLFADEIVLVDMTESEKIKGLERFSNVKRIKHKKVSHVEIIRNFGISKATGDWILILDPDEEVEPSLIKELKAIVKKPKVDYYRLPRKNIIFDKWIKHSRWWPDYNLRFFKKGFVSWSEVIHSVPITQGKGRDLPSEQGFAIVHYHYNSIDQFIERLTRYTSAHAELLVKDSYKFSWKDLLVKPSNEFLSRYFQGKGYKDGIHGLALASLQSFSELVLYLKVWQKQGFKDQELKIEEVAREVKKVNAARNYWVADSLYKAGGGLMQRIKRKFKLR